MISGRAELESEGQGADRQTVFHGPRVCRKICQDRCHGGVEAALEFLNATPEEDEEAYRAALRALDDFKDTFKKK